MHPGAHDPAETAVVLAGPDGAVERTLLKTRPRDAYAKG